MPVRIIMGHPLQYNLIIRLTRSLGYIMLFQSSPNGNSKAFLIVGVYLFCHKCRKDYFICSTMSKILRFKYFNFHVCLSFLLSLCVCPKNNFNSSVLQNATNKSCLVCYESEKYPFWVTPLLPRVHGALRAISKFM